MNQEIKNQNQLNNGPTKEDLIEIADALDALKIKINTLRLNLNIMNVHIKDLIKQIEKTISNVKC